jgi:hypothetical protein
MRAYSPVTDGQASAFVDIWQECYRGTNLT